MPDGKHCPRCGKDIGVWAVFSASLPSRVRCPHCKTRLWVSHMMAAQAAPPITNARTTATAISPATGVYHRAFVFRALTFGAVLAVAWVPVELAIVRYLRANARLVLRGEEGDG